MIRPKAAYFLKKWEPHQVYICNHDFAVKDEEGNTFLVYGTTYGLYKYDLTTFDLSRFTKSDETIESLGFHGSNRSLYVDTREVANE